jgi:hypothetical protein
MKSGVGTSGKLAKPGRIIHVGVMYQIISNLVCADFHPLALIDYVNHQIYLIPRPHHGSKLFQILSMTYIVLSGH